MGHKKEFCTSKLRAINEQSDGDSEEIEKEEPVRIPSTPKMDSEAGKNMPRFCGKTREEWEKQWEDEMVMEERKDEEW